MNQFNANNVKMADHELSFRYPALNPNIPSFRLVTLLKESNTDASFDPEINSKSSDWSIRCELSLSHLGSNEDYEAVSYYWGDPGRRDRTQTIQLDGKPYKVSVVVEYMLSRLHDRRSNRKLWIDAICIDQNNNKERALQISRMRDIYGQAKMVVAFLATEGIYDQRLTEDRRPDALHIVKSLKVIQRKKSKLAGVLIRPFDPGEQPDVGSFLAHPWFSRIWVVQEVGVAHKVYFVGDVGTEGADAQELTSFAQIYKNHSGGILAPRLQKLDHFFAYLAHDLRDIKNRNLLTILHLFRPWTASDPRDKVYALLGLSCDEYNNSTLAPDYDISVPELFRKVARYMLVKHKNLRVLTYTALKATNTASTNVAHPDTPTPTSARSSSAEDIPSWCPDWSLESYYPQNPDLEPEAKSTSSGQFRSRRGKQKSTKSQDISPWLNLDISSNELRVCGFHIGSVKAIYHDNSVEVELSSTWEKAYTTWPWAAFSRYLKNVQIQLVTQMKSTLQVEDQVVVLQGSTGLALLRKAGNSLLYRLVCLQHSQYDQFGEFKGETQDYAFPGWWIGSVNLVVLQALGASQDIILRSSCSDWELGFDLSMYTLI